MQSGFGAIREPLTWAFVIANSAISVGLGRFELPTFGPPVSPKTVTASTNQYQKGRYRPAGELVLAEPSGHVGAGGLWHATSAEISLWTCR